MCGWFPVLVAAACGVLAEGAGPVDLRFKRAEKDGFYQFDTGKLRGKVRLDGKSQGIVELWHTESGTPVAAGGGLPGIFSYYRIFSTDTRYGHAARDWPTQTEILPDGALKVHWAAAKEHPLEMTALYRWQSPDTLDLETTVTPEKNMPRFEVFLSSYFTSGFRASVYVRPNYFSRSAPEFLPADVNPMVDGSYLMFPRDREAALKIFDRRWEIPPDPVQWSVTRWLAAPLALRRDGASRVTALIMAPPEDCFAVSMPYNKTPPDGVAGHQSLYLSLFGQDVTGKQTVRARTRLVVAKDVSNQEAVALYTKFLAERKR